MPSYDTQTIIMVCEQLENYLMAEREVTKQYIADNPDDDPSNIEYLKAQNDALQEIAGHLEGVRMVLDYKPELPDFDAALLEYFNDEYEDYVGAAGENLITAEGWCSEWKSAEPETCGMCHWFKEYGVSRFICLNSTRTDCSVARSVEEGFGACEHFIRAER